MEECIKEGIKNVTTEIETILKTITSDLKELAQKHGAKIIIGLVIVYLWKKIK